MTSRPEQISPEQLADLHLALSLIERALVQRHAFDDVLVDETGLTLTQLVTLSEVERLEDHATSRQLAATLGRTNHTIVNLVTAVERKGLVQRLAREHSDRRIVPIAITPKGEETLSWFRERREAILAKVFPHEHREPAVPQAAVEAYMRLFTSS